MQLLVAINIAIRGSHGWSDRSVISIFLLFKGINKKDIMKL